MTKTDLLKTKLWVEFEGEAGKKDQINDVEMCSTVLSLQASIMAVWLASGSFCCRSKCLIPIMVI